VFKVSKNAYKPPLHPSAQWLGNNVNMDEIPDDDDCTDQSLPGSGQ